MSKQRPGMIAESLTRDLLKRLALRKLMIGPAGLIWLTLCAQSRGFPAQQLLAAQAPEQELPQPTEPQLFTHGNISGTVIDTTGAVVAGARLTLTRADQFSSPEVLSG